MNKKRYYPFKTIAICNGFCTQLRNTLPCPFCEQSPATYVGCREGGYPSLDGNIWLWILGQNDGSTYESIGGKNKIGAEVNIFI